MDVRPIRDIHARDRLGGTDARFSLGSEADTLEACETAFPVAAGASGFGASAVGVVGLWVVNGCLKECKDGREGDGTVDREDADRVDEWCGDGDGEYEVWCSGKKAVGETLGLEEEVPVEAAIRGCPAGLFQLTWYISG